ncbi:ribonucleoprotein PTB-binding 2 isoform X3 [Monodelphis domestica]|uniref:ribonucleoprotein PTB-binding 2 isoform X3 n=1 Tax=Monodelphis domestica TaxID=13616 RepID=UPI0024E22AED|nr:ribonucleoprotein PTB-binding 2 isoform X3 [Monodelphis domestica]
MAAAGPEREEEVVVAAAVEAAGEPEEPGLVPAAAPEPLPPGASTAAEELAQPPEPPEPLGAAEVARRLQRTRRELSNRRKVLLRNLPPDTHSQEVHDLLKDYELKYCYVDRNKRTAFVTLLDGEQAQNAIQTFHQYSLRGKEITVQLQPTDALLCITNLPPSFTIEEFEELVRTFGNIERCFLVYNETTGHSKGYGFVEYMKKDSAAKARSELLGKQLGSFILFAQWMDVNQLATDLIHSKCLCVDKLPRDLTDSQELLQIFSFSHKPVFGQLAQDEGSYADGFAVVEYDSPEHAEDVQQAADGMTIKGSQVQVSFCAPGASGRSTLAALIAAQRMMRNNRKGLLPEPNPIQIMKSLNNPAMLQILLQPQLQGPAAVLGAPHSLPHLVNPSITPAILQLNKIHQNSVLSNASRLLLQNLSYLHLAQQQLMKIENIQTNSKPGLLGEPPAMVLPTALGAGAAPPLKSELGLRGEEHKTAAGLLPFFPNQHVVGPSHPQDKPSAALGSAEGAASGLQTYLPGFTNPPAGGSAPGQPRQASQPKASEASSGTVSKNQTSLLGEPPKEIRLSTNPYLNLASVLPGVCLPAPVGSKTMSALPQTGITSNILDAISQGTSSQHALENYINYSQQFGDYSQVSSPLRNEKRGSTYLISAPEGSSGELVDQHSQGTGGYYAESCLKKKRVY